MPGSIDSPHSRQRHPTTASELEDSCIRLTIMRPWQRRHCIESSNKSDLQHFPQRISPYNACIDRLSLISMTIPNPAPPDEHQEADHATSPPVEPHGLTAVVPIVSSAEPAEFPVPGQCPSPEDTGCNHLRCPAERVRPGQANHPRQPAYGLL